MNDFLSINTLRRFDIVKQSRKVGKKICRLYDMFEWQVPIGNILNDFNVMFTSALANFGGVGGGRADDSSGP